MGREGFEERPAVEEGSNDLGRTGGRRDQFGK